MRPMIYASGALVAAAAACSATGSVDPQGPDAGAPQEEAGALPVDAAPSEAASDAGVDAERALVCGDAGFCETRLPKSELGTPLSLRSVWAVATNDVWSVTAEGTILHYDGQQWSVAHRVGHELFVVWATGSDVWVGGEAGLLLHRDGASKWTQVETKHVSPIRAILGIDTTDIWFTRDGASVDHFDGARLENRRIDVPGLRIKSLFGRAGLGVYAAGYVPGALTESGFYDHRAYVFSVSNAGISLFNATLPQQSGFAPISGAVRDSGDGSPTVFLLGYQAYASSNYFKSTSFTADATAELTFMTPSPTQEEVARPVPVLAHPSADTWVVRHMGLIQRWDGSSYTNMSLAMGRDVSPGAVFGAHAAASELWFVGDGFALRGPTP